MARTNTAKNVIVSAYVTDIAVVSLHTADPGTTGINEITGGSPAYARITRPTFTTPTTGGITFQTNFNVGAGTAAITHAGYWDGSGNFLEGAPLNTPSPVYASQGTLTLTTTAQAS